MTPSHRSLPVFLILIGALVWPASAAAKVSFFEGRGVNDPKVRVSFDLHIEKRGTVEVTVRDLEIDNMTQVVTCKGQSYDEDLRMRWHKNIDVDPDDASFESRRTIRQGGTFTAKVKGEFDNKGRNATLSFRLEGDAGGCKVDTGKIRMKAEKV